MNASQLLLLSLLMCALQNAVALVCYERGENGTVTAPDCPDCKYCSFAEMRPKAGKPSMFGVQPLTLDDDSFDAFDKLFGETSSLYEVLSVCVLEKYVTPPLLKGDRPHVEVMLRCMCNKDRCNIAVSVDDFLKELERRARLQS